jgi:uncharacterized protein (TIGR02757 family)
MTVEELPPLRRRRRPWAELGAELEGFVAGFPAAERLRSDPVQLVHRYRRRADQEVAAYVAGVLAFGRVGSLVPKARAVLDVLGERPAERLRDTVPPLPRDWVHRWITRDDMRWLLDAIGRTLREDGSLLAVARAAQPAGTGDLLPAMAGLTARLRDAARGVPDSQGRQWLAPRADGTGAAKRLCLLFRWLVRPADGVDLGPWSELGPERLTVALDTHVARIGRYIGLTERRSPGWAMARDITDSLRRIDPVDPVRFDFAVSHLGIMGACPRRRRAATCASCELLRICRI